MFRTALAAALLAAFLAPSARAGDSLESVLAKHYEALGGLEKLGALQNISFKGHIVVGEGMEAPFTLMKRRPEQLRLEFTFQGLTGVQAWDGTQGWSIMPFMGKKDPELMSGDDAKEAALQAEWGGPLLSYKEKGHKLELTGKEKVEGTDAYKIKVTRKDGTVQYVYLDADSFLEIKTEGKRTMNGMDVDYQNFSSDYKAIDGLMMPYLIENGFKGSSKRQKIVIDSITLNQSLADSLFAAPAGAKKTAPAASATKPDGSASDAAGTSTDGKPATTKSTKTKSTTKKPSH